MGLGQTTMIHHRFLAEGKGGISPTSRDFRSALLTPAVTAVALFVDVTGIDSVGTNLKGQVLLKYLFLLFTLWLNQTLLQKN